MNFFQAQDQAHSQTRRLILLFILAVATLILITAICVAVFVWFSNPELAANTPSNNGPLATLKHITLNLGADKLVWISIIIISAVGLASLLRWSELRQGGAVIAESLGGRLLPPNTENLPQRQLLNIVEEMALAAGVPVPQVYLLTQEQGINAFAAGLSPEDAVIGVTQGCIDSLSREQLQGVVAHEFSHILNGDMRMNQKIVAILAGLLMIGHTGTWIIEISRTRRSSYSRNSNRENAGIALIILGICLVAIGWLGQFFGALIQSAVSRQREFLADASAVQFTRNPDGIGGALQVIGGYHPHSFLNHHRARELGHFFFCSAKTSGLSYFNTPLFATHPALDDRISRILPGWSGQYLDAAPSKMDGSRVHGYVGPKLNNDGSIEYDASLSPLATYAGASALTARKQSVSTTQPTTPTHTSAENNSPTVSQEDARTHFDQLKQAAREPSSARSLVLALLLDHDQKIRSAQLDSLHGEDIILTRDINACWHQLQKLDQDDYLNLLELSIPALKSLSNKQYQKMRGQMSQLILADGKVELYEWAMFQIVRQYCDLHFGLRRAPQPKYRTPDSLSTHYLCVLSKLIHTGNQQDDEKQKAFDRGCNAAGFYTAKLLPAEQCTSAAFTRAASELGLAFPLLKPRLLKGLIQSAKSDKLITPSERQLITAISVIMDCPLIGLAIGDDPA